MTDERDVPTGKSAPKRRTSRKRSESEVDRMGLAGVIHPRVEQLAGEGHKRPAIANMAGCAESVLRQMANGSGTSMFSEKLLKRAARGLSLSEGEVVDAFYPPLPGEPESSSSAGPPRQQATDQLAPYLEKINAIPALQKDVAEIKKDMKGMGDAVYEINAKLTTAFVDFSRAHSTE